MSRRSRHLTALESEAREAELAALFRLNRYAAGLSTSVEPDDVRRALAMLATALQFHQQPKESET